MIDKEKQQLIRCRLLIITTKRLNNMAKLEIELVRIFTDSHKEPPVANTIHKSL